MHPSRVFRRTRMRRDSIQPGNPSFKVGARGRRILHTGAWSLIAKAVAAANLFLTIPFVLQALGAAQFGVWATLVSLLAFAGFLDFGLGNGAMNMVAAAHGRGDSSDFGAIMREARRALFIIAVALATASILALPWIPWHRILGAPDAMATSVRASVAVVLLTVAIAVPLNLANRVQLGMGQGDRAFRWQALGQALTACTVILLAKAGARLEYLVAAAVATPLLTSIANNIQLWRNHPAFDHANQKRDPAIATAIRNEGALFFCLQLAAILAYSADLPLISALRGPEDAGTYAIVQRLFSIIPMGLALIWAPLWPIYRQALAAGDRDWVNRTLRWSTLTAVSFAAVGGATITIGFNTIETLWLKQPIYPPAPLLIGFAAWAIFEALGNSLATLLNAASVLRFQVVIASAFALLCIAGKFLALLNGNMNWVPWVTLVAWITCVLLPLIIYNKKLHTLVFARMH